MVHPLSIDDCVCMHQSCVHKNYKILAKMSPIGTELYTTFSGSISITKCSTKVVHITTKLMKKYRMKFEMYALP